MRVAAGAGEPAIIAPANIVLQSWKEMSPMSSRTTWIVAWYQVQTHILNQFAMFHAGPIVKTFGRWVDVPLPLAKRRDGWSFMTSHLKNDTVVT